MLPVSISLLFSIVLNVDDLAHVAQISLAIGSGSTRLQQSPAAKRVFRYWDAISTIRDFIIVIVVVIC